jgi:hypothetical protein
MDVSEEHIVSIFSSEEQARSETICFPVSFLLGLFIDLEDEYNMFLRNVGRLFNGLQGILSYNIALFISTDVRASNPT